MNARFLSLAASLMVPAAMVFAQSAPTARPTASAPVDVDERFRTIDELLARVRLMMAQLEGVVKAAEPALKTVRMADPAELSAQARKKLEQRCAAEFSIDTLARHKTPPLIYGTKSPIVGMVDGIRHYYECEAFIQRKPELCKTLSRYQDWEVNYTQTVQGRAIPDVFDVECEDSYVRFNVIQLNLMGGPGAARKACGTLFSSVAAPLGTGLREQCDWMTGGEAGEKCENLITATYGKPVINCVYQKLLQADASSCSSIRSAPANEVGTRTLYQELCRDVVAYRRAYAAKDAKLCGDSVACRMLMGEKACGRHLDQFKGEYCRSWTQENLKDAVAVLLAEQQAAGKRGAEIMEILKQRRASLEAFFGQLNDSLESFEPKSEAAYVLRRDAYRALRRKFEQPAKKKAPSHQAPARAGRQTSGQ